MSANTMIFSIRNLAGSAVLSGAQAGRKLLAKLIAEVAHAAEPQIAFLDFAGVQVATSSFLRESVLGFRDYARLSLLNVYPVVANANEAVREELDFFVTEQSDAIWVCEIDRHGKPRHSRLIGVLDPTEKETLKLATRHRRVSAPALAAMHPNAGVKATAWNNRLASLADKGLLIESRLGKSKIFSPVLVES